MDAVVAAVDKDVLDMVVVDGGVKSREKEKNRRIIQRQSCNGSAFFVVVRTLLLWWGEGTERNEMMNVMNIVS